MELIHSEKQKTILFSSPVPTEFRAKCLKRASHPTVLIMMLFIMLSGLLTGCAPPGEPVVKCTVLMEDNPALFFSGQIYEVDRFHDLSITVGVPRGERIASVSYEDYTVSPRTGSSLSFDYYTLTLNRIRYPEVIRLDTAPAYTTAYHPGDASGGAEGKVIAVEEDSPHLYCNTLPYREQFTRQGYLPIGWNTSSDGSGTHVGFGSRIDRTGQSQLDLYAEWLPCTPAQEFTYILGEDEVTITGYHGDGNIVLPLKIEGRPVTRIARDAFLNVDADILALPHTLKEIEAGAFRSLTVTDFYLFDNMEELSEASFERCQILHLHINAVLDPVYSGSYFDTLPDKTDYLASLQDKPKIVLFCGSSARFGYDSTLFEAAFPDYHVVNMGVFAYSNMLPLSKIVLKYMNEGDILLSSPELDAIDKQFCGENALDKETFCMMESNYDMFAALDCREFTNVFGAFSDYNAARKNMSPRSYQDSPSYYDEDGNRQDSFTYNRQGDYLLYRDNNHSRKSFGVKRAFYNPSHIRAKDWEGLNQMYDAFTEKGVRVFFTYSPRSSISISKDSTPDTITKLDQAFREKLHAPVISSIESSLMDPLYFYGTDNHLSTEGAALHTKKVIDDLRRALEE